MDLSGVQYFLARRQHHLATKRRVGLSGITQEEKKKHGKARRDLLLLKDVLKPRGVPLVAVHCERTTQGFGLLGPALGTRIHAMGTVFLIGRLGRKRKLLVKSQMSHCQHAVAAEYAGVSCHDGIQSRKKTGEKNRSCGN